MWTCCSLIAQKCFKKLILVSDLGLRLYTESQLCMLKCGTGQPPAPTPPQTRSAQETIDF